MLTHLIKQLSRLPGIGAKSAARIAYYLLQTDRAYTESLSDDIREIQHRIRRCSVCGSFTEADPCDVCSDLRRDRSRICVVEQPQDVPVLEATGAFAGLYHVLGGVISPIDGIGPEDLSVAKLIDRATDVSEVIFATNPTVEGDTTALYVAKLLEERGIPVSRLALGLPVGGDLEYADRLTIERSLRGRTRLTTER
ncbi:MAG: recombination protein RecR [Spirochaetaceae bacterium]|nr:recombination protein RecR [Spirochaetaceae bacterium]